MKTSTALAELSGTSQASQSALPDTWIEKLFQKMEDRYGDLWATRYGSFPRSRVKQTWAEDLGDLSGEEVARGVAACRSAKFPPTLPEFRALCRPPIGFEIAFHEAVQQMSARESGKDRWTSPAIFWAAVTIGAFDLRNGSWQSLEKRWRKVLQAEIDKGEWQPIPVRAVALPAPPVTKESREAAERTLKALGVKLKECGDKAWAQRIIDRAAAGEPVAYQALKMAKEALATVDYEAKDEA